MEAPQPALRGEGLPPAWKAAWAVFFLALWAVGLSLQNPGLMADDSGEMAAAAFCLGLPHPPGYPLVTLLGHLAIRLPLGSPAFRMNLLSLSFLMGACVCWVVIARGTAARLFPVFSRQTRWVQEASLAPGVLTLFSSRNVLSQALSAKGGVYTLTLLLSMALLGCLLSRRSEGERALYAVAGLWALGLCAHWETFVTWLPALGLWAWYRRKSMPQAAVWSAGAILLAALSIYLLPPIRGGASPAMEWGSPTTAQGYLWTLLRGPFAGGEIAWGGKERMAAVWTVVGKILIPSAWPCFACLVLVGWARPFSRGSRLGAESILAFWGPTLALMFYIQPSRLDLGNVFTVAQQGAWVLVGWWGVWKIAEWFRPSKAKTAVLLSLWCAAPLVWLPSRVNREDKSRYFLAQDLGTEILQALPRDAFFLAEGDLTAFSIWYEKVALGKRPDVAMVPPQFFLHPWGWKQAVEQRPSLGKLDLAMAPPAVQWDAIRVSCGPVSLGAPGGLYLSQDRGLLTEAGPPWVGEAVPCGLCWCASGVPVSVGEFRARWRDVLASRRLRVAEEPEGSRGDDVVSRQILRYHAADALAQARWLEDRGDDWGSLGALERGLRWEPSVPGLWAAAARSAGKLGYPEASVELCQRGLVLDPDSRELLHDLRYAGWLARREPTGGKAKYEGLLGHARALGWRVLAESFQSTKRRLVVSLETKGRIR